MTLKLRYKMIVFSFFLVIALVLNPVINAQMEANNWIFNGFNMRFNDDTMNIELNDLNVYTTQGYTSISDSLGNLLIYTNSYKVWDKNDNLLMNGDSILIPGMPKTEVLLSLIIPKPGNSEIYYIFTVDPYNSNISSGLYYAEVDLSKNDGDGLVTAKRIKLIDSTTSMISSVYHANHDDIWVITQKNLTNMYYSFLINSDGVNSNPVISSVGKTIGTYNGSVTAQLKCSPDSKKIAVSYSNSPSNGEGFELFDFNNETGELTNPLIFTLPDRWCQSIEFSPDATKLYAYQAGSSGESGLYQFNISSRNYTDINESRELIIREKYNSFVYLQLAPDHKIYISKGGGGGGGDYLGIIYFPNEIGINCTTIENGIHLQGAYSTNITMPNYLQNYFYRTSFEIFSTCYNDSTTFKITNTYRLDSVKWDLGDGTISRILNPKHIFTKPQTYTVTLFAYYPDKIDTIQKKVTIHPLPLIDLGSDTTVCHGYKFDLTSAGFSIYWFDTINSRTYLPDTSGTYWVRSQNEFGCIYKDTIDLLINPTPYFSLGGDTLLCDNSTYLLQPDSVYNNCSYFWENGKTDPYNLIDTCGIYWLEIINEYGCSYLDTIKIESIKAPEVYIGKDTMVYQNRSIILYAGYFGYPTTYLWDDYSTYQYRSIIGSMFELGLYDFYITVTAPNGCSASDTISVEITAPTVINMNENDYNTNIYPNPFSDKLIIEINDPKVRYIEIYNSSGKLLISKYLTQKQLDLSILSEGLYLLLIYEKSIIRYSSKLIKK